MNVMPNPATTGAVLVLTYTLYNPDPGPLSNISFTNVLPATLRVAAVPGVTISCGSGAVNAPAGSGIVTVSNVSLAGSRS